MEKGAVEERGQGGGSREKVRAEEWERQVETPEKATLRTSSLATEEQILLLT